MGAMRGIYFANYKSFAAAVCFWAALEITPMMP
jgi:hypothetical protein